MPPSPSPTPLIIYVEDQLEALEDGTNIEAGIEYGIVTIIFTPELFESMADEDGNVEDLYLTKVEWLPEDDHETFVEVEFGITRDGEEVLETYVPIIVRVDLSGFDLEDMHPNRIVAILEDGTLIRGHMDPETGIFIFETTVVSGFSVVYLPNLRIIGLQIGCYNIMDLIYDELLLVMPDTTPVIQNNRTLVPLRFVAYVMDAAVEWNPDGRIVTIERAGRILSFAIGEMAPGMDVPAQIMNNRTMVPLRFIAEFFDAQVTWCPETRSIEIIKW